MAKPKQKRNKRFIRAWREEGLSDKQLGQRFSLSLGGVKGLKQRLRAKDPSLYTNPLVSKPASQEAGKLAKYRKMTFYLDPGRVKTIKMQAVEEGKGLSELVREILEGYLE